MSVLPAAKAVVNVASGAKTAVNVVNVVGPAVAKAAKTTPQPAMSTPPQLKPSFQRVKKARCSLTPHPLRPQVNAASAARVTAMAVIAVNVAATAVQTAQAKKVKPI